MDKSLNHPHNFDIIIHFASRNLNQGDFVGLNCHIQWYFLFRNQRINFGLAWDGGGAAPAPPHDITLLGKKGDLGGVLLIKHELPWGKRRSSENRNPYRIDSIRISALWLTFLRSSGLTNLLLVSRPFVMLGFAQRFTNAAQIPELCKFDNS